MEDDAYENAIWNRKNWIDPEGCGEVTYCGDYAVITGLRTEEMSELLPGEGRYITLMYSVGIDSVMDSGCVIVGRYEADHPDYAILNHDNMVIQAENMDLLEFSHGS